MTRAVELVDLALRTRRRGYVCVTGVHGIMEAQRDPHFRSILNSAFLTTPDGMPTVWVGHWQGFGDMDRVYGPDLMVDVCRMSVAKGYTHFLFGGKPGVADRLKSVLEDRFPGLRIVGTFCPPFRPLNPDETAELRRRVAELHPDCFWVGLSTPKQERFMHEFWPLLDTTLMFGVGAAFDINAGLVSDSPYWMKRAGLQWLHRLCTEPRRLWKRYLRNNPEFIVKIVAQIVGLRSYAIRHAGTSR